MPVTPKPTEVKGMDSYLYMSNYDRQIEVIPKRTLNLQIGNGGLAGTLTNDQVIIIFKNNCFYLTERFAERHMFYDSTGEYRGYTIAEMKKIIDTAAKRDGGFWLSAGPDVTVSPELKAASDDLMAAGKLKADKYTPSYVNIGTADREKGGSE